MALVVNLTIEGRELSWAHDQGRSPVLGCPPLREGDLLATL